MDGGDHDPADLQIPAERFVAHDLEPPLDVGRTFDLALCLEVAEHLAPEAAATLVASLVAAAPAIAFSAAIPRQGGVHHVNEQWPAYWASLFAQHGYVARDVLRPVLWTDERVAWWYAQNLVLYVRDDGEPVEPLPLVHPRRYLEWVEWGLEADAARWAEG